MTGPGPAGAALLQATGGKYAYLACLIARDDRDATGWRISMGMMVVCTPCGNLEVYR